MWSKKYCDSNPNIDLKEVLSNFLEFIRFHQIPANVLMREIHPLGNSIWFIWRVSLEGLMIFFLGFSGLVPDHLIMNALAYQADPSCVDPAKLSPTPPRGGRRRSQARSMSVQSSLDPYGSSTTLNSESASSEIESSPRLSSDGSRGSPLGRLSNWPDYQRSRSVLKFTVAPKCLVQLCARMI